MTTGLRCAARCSHSDISCNRLLKKKLVTSDQKSAADAARLFRVHSATISRLLARHRAEQLDKTPAPEPKPPVKKKSVAKKVSSRKRTAKKKAEAPVDTIMDAIGLVRPASFKDFPGAVSMMAEAKTLPVKDRMEWKASPRRHMAMWEAEKHLQKCRQKASGGNGRAAL